ncbi:hypothetical protein LTR91_022595 [Friedmanniomyces endolithicus]|uniref:Methyltransferase type 11 domain-containing protein n=1 Tax=Friedmanniomyces endolithicus TaxID=329885 RepID=A0AAN6J8W0_9PEZI|nr:hypothetical protein LTR82_008460 [Friedmanniomyces endolithicus]KAK0928152.1 hypothetical protein LTR57_002886 [Friedmanniomyces endolithicus]KAK0956010.1 hypothetical protein LTR91_022595 [Friedmanniomyces endolithicus]
MAGPSHHGINARAAEGFADSANYDRHRPGYTPTVVEQVLQQCRVSGRKHAKILDLAAGGGKFTELLARRPEGFEIVAVEPHDGMREVLERKGLAGVSVKAGRADGIPLEDESVDAVVVAQAFHWFATPPALKEIHRVLRPHGTLALLWNIEDYNAPRTYPASTPWESTMRELTWTFQDDEARFRHQEWKKVFEDQSRSSPWSLLVAGEQFFALPLGEWEEGFEVRLGKREVWERYATISSIVVQGAGEREKTHKTVMDALNGPEVEVNDKGEVALHGRTFVVWTSKIPEDGRESLLGVETPES